MKTKKATAGKTAKMLGMFALTCGLLFTNCAKDGKAGPQGPTGPQGPAGINGNANVKSQIIATTSADWTGNGEVYVAIKTCSVITTDIHEKGAVMVYIKDGSEYIALPFSAHSNSSNYTSHYFFTTAVGTITIYVQDDDGFTPNPSNQTFKVVAIASSQITKHPNLDLKNYQEVKKVLQLAD